jgi:hypothetical protein
VNINTQNNNTDPITPINNINPAPTLYAQIPKADLSLSFEIFAQKPIPKSTFNTRITKFVKPPTTAKELFNTSWASIAKQINKFVLHSFKEKSDGYQTIQNEYGTYNGFVRNKLPTNGSMIFPSGTFSGYFEKGIPKFYGQIITEKWQLEGSFRDGNPIGSSYISFFQSIKEKFYIKCPSISRQKTEPAQINLPLMLNEFFSSFDQPIANGRQTLQNKYGTFDGDFLYGLPVQGSVHVEGAVYEGSFLNKLPHGKGTLKTAYGSYVGEFSQGKEHGIGKLYILNGKEYSGKFQNNDYEGYGELKSANGSVYKGHFVNSMKQGTGLNYFADGDLMDGIWENDSLNGKGTYYFSNGDKVEANWTNDYISGLGKLTYVNGIVFEGKWVNNIRQPIGTMRYLNGDVYRGMCVDDQRHGLGTMEYADGRVETVIWKKNEVAAVQDCSESSFSRIDRTLSNNPNKKIKTSSRDDLASCDSEPLETEIH